MTPTAQWHVYLTARDEQRGLDARRQLSDKGLSVNFHQLDVTNAESRNRLFDFIKKNYPNGINILVNNAGIVNEVWKVLTLSDIIGRCIIFYVKYAGTTENGGIYQAQFPRRCGESTNERRN